MYQTQLCLNVQTKHNIYRNSNFNHRNKKLVKKNTSTEWERAGIRRKKGELSDGGIIGAGGSPHWGGWRPNINTQCRKCLPTTFSIGAHILHVFLLTHLCKVVKYWFAEFVHTWAIGPAWFYRQKKIVKFSYMYNAYLYFTLKFKFFRLWLEIGKFPKVLTFHNSDNQIHQLRHFAIPTYAKCSYLLMQIFVFLPKEINYYESATRIFVNPWPSYSQGQGM